MTFVIITAGIDLSVGSVLVFAGVIAATLMETLSPGGDASDAGPGVVLLGLLGALPVGALGVCSTGCSWPGQGSRP